MVRTNMQRQGDNRPLPPGILRIPVRPPPPPSTTPAVPCRRRITAQLAALATNADELVTTQLYQIRLNMTGYNSHYPAAVQVRTLLGATKWEKLERYRSRIAKFAAFMRKLEREHLTVAHTYLDSDYYPAMKTYVEKACGRYMREIFENHHDTMADMIKYDAEYNRLGIQEGSVMITVREYFHRRPFLWFAFNLYFPITGRMGEKGRMSWVQLKDWAVWTLQNPSEEPSWFTWVRASKFVPSSELVPVPVVTPHDEVWNAALIEAFEDVGARFADASSELLMRLSADGVARARFP